MQKSLKEIIKNLSDDKIIKITIEIKTKTRVIENKKRRVIAESTRKKQ